MRDKLKDRDYYNFGYFYIVIGQRVDGGRPCPDVTSENRRVRRMGEQIWGSEFRGMHYARGERGCFWY